MKKTDMVLIGEGVCGIIVYEMERRISTILLIVLLLGVGLYGLRGSTADHALAEPRSRPLSDAPWGANVRVNDDTGGAAQYYPSMAVDGSGNGYVVWQDYRNGIWYIYFSYRPAGGSWGPNVKVNDDTGTTSYGWPSIAVDASGNAYVVWYDYPNGNYDIYFSYRPAGGTWGANVKVNDDGGTADQEVPSIAVDASGNAYAVWHDHRNGNPDIYFSYRPAGSTWGANVKVNDDGGTADQEVPSIAVDASGNAYAVWHDHRNGNPDIYFSYRPAGGSWGPNVKVNDDAGTAGQGWPSIAVDASGNAYVVWYDERNGNPDIYFSYRPAGGSWGPNVKANDDTGTAGQGWPSIAVDASGNAYVVWQDMRNGNPDIYFSYRPAGGAWGANVRVNDDAGMANQYYPSIAVDGSGNAYAVWQDYRNYSTDIYFSYLPAGGGPVLRLPFNPAEKSGVCHNSQDGLNCLSSYFDHKYPLYGAEGAANTNTVVVYWGNEIPSTTERCRPQQITGEGKVCYSGHDAYDFALPAGTQVRAAADGTVTYIPNDPYGGKVLEIDHGNGFRTAYWHLQNAIVTSGHVTANQVIGTVGSTGNATGPHLHFAVRRNGIVVDPYGWTGNYQDPWLLNGGAESTCLWNFACPTRGVFSPAAGGTVSSSDGNILVSAPPGAVTDTTWLQLALTADPVAEPSAVPAWHSFALSAQDLSGNPIVDFSEPLTLEVHYSDDDLTYLSEDTLSLYSWDDLTSAWLPISTVLDLVNNKATANTTHLSLFTLMGQPLNPAPTVISVSPSNGYSHLDTEITIVGTGFISTPSVRLGLNELAVTFIDSATLTAVVPSGLVPGTYDLTVTNPDAQEGTLEAAFTVLEPLKVYLPLIFKNY